MAKKKMKQTNGPADYTTGTGRLFQRDRPTIPKGPADYPKGTVAGVTVIIVMIMITCDKLLLRVNQELLTSSRPTGSPDLLGPGS